MTKRAICLGLLLLLALAANAQAAGITDPVNLAEAGQFQLGLEATYQSRIKFNDTVSDASRRYSDGTGMTYQYAVTDVTLKEDQYYFLTLNYGLLKQLDLFAKAGLVRGGKKTSGSLPGQYYDLREALAWAVGGKWRLLEAANGLLLTLAGQYLRFDGRKQAPAWNINQERDYKMDHWRADLELVGAWRLGQFTPYVGGVYTYSELKVYGDTTSVRGGLIQVTYSDYVTRNSTNWGGVAGLAWDFCPAWRLNLQGEYLDGLTASLSLSYSFQLPWAR
ncbi:MAG: hypothetical protein HY910_13600 [Desulfarculus sp.]|nr:hypothetical protein [Desulfarculus sp.]